MNTMLLRLLLLSRSSLVNVVDVVLHGTYVNSAVGSLLPLNVAHIVEVRLTSTTFATLAPRCIATLFALIHRCL